MHLRGAPGVFLLTLLLSVLLTGGHLYSPDEEIMFRVTESLATRGRLAVEPIVAGDGSTFATRRGTDGLEYAQYGVGNSLLGVPFYWMGAAVSGLVPDASAARALDFHTQLYAPEGPGRGHGLLKRFFVSFSGAFVLAATAALVFGFCRGLAARDDGRYPAAACWMTALAYGAGTLALAHSRTFFSEPLATFFVLLSFALLALAPGGGLSNRRAAAAGAAFALALFTRLDSVFAAPGVGILLLCRLPVRGGGAGVSGAGMGLAREVRGRISGAAFARLVFFALPMLAFFGWQMAMNRLHFGSPFSSAYADQPEGINFSTPIIAGVYGFLFSIGKSVLLFSPAVLLAMLGFGRFWQQHRAVALGLAVSAVSVLLVHASWQNWAGGWCWGPRHIFMIHALVMVPAVAFVAQPGRGRRWFVEATLLVGFLVQVYGSSQNFIDYYVLYFRTPFSQPQARVMYGGEDLAPSYIQAVAVGPTGETVPFPVQAMPAPINDSIYVPQNSQWYRYAEMWNSGYTDNLWLRWIQRQRGREQPIE